LYFTPAGEDSVQGSEADCAQDPSIEGRQRLQARGDAHTDICAEKILRQ